MSLCLKLNCICERTETGYNSHSNCTLPPSVPPVPLRTSGALSLCLSLARLFLSFISFTSYTRVLFCIPPVCCLLSLVAFQLIIAKYSYACNCCTALGRALAARHTNAQRCGYRYRYRYMATTADRDTQSQCQLSCAYLFRVACQYICVSLRVRTCICLSVRVCVCVFCICKSVRAQCI